MREIIKKILNNLIEKIQILIKKDEGIIIIGSWFGKRYSDNSRYLYQYLNENKKKFGLKKIIWITTNKKIYLELKEKKYVVYKKYSIKSIFYHLKARYHIVDQSKNDIIGSLSASSKTVKINLWHGMPLKKIGSYIKNSNKTDNEILGKWNQSKFLVCSEFGKNLIGSAFKVKDNDCIFGMYPRNYYLTNGKIELLKDEIKIIKKINAEKKMGKKIIFYAPTFRDKIKLKFLGSEKEKELVDFFSFLKEKNYLFITKFHFAENNIKNYSNYLDEKNFENFLNLSDTIDIYPILKEVDILITDYSSVFFDFLYLDKEIIFMPYDLKYYESEDRGLLLEYDKYTPGKKVKNINSLIEYLSLEKEVRDQYKEKRKKLLKLCFENYSLDDTIYNIFGKEKK